MLPVHFGSIHDRLILYYRAMTRDVTKYDDPDTFCPERFEGQKGADTMDPRNYVFGFGRR